MSESRIQEMSPAPKVIYGKEKYSTRLQYPCNRKSRIQEMSPAPKVIYGKEKYSTRLQYPCNRKGKKKFSTQKSFEVLFKNPYAINFFRRSNKTNYCTKPIYYKSKPLKSII